MADLEEKPGCGMPIAWFITSGLIFLIGAAAVGAAAYRSESGGVSAAYMAAGPLGFVCSGAAGAFVIHFLVKSGEGRVWGPFGCGCLGAGLIGIGTWIFFTAIFPSL